MCLVAHHANQKAVQVRVMCPIQADAFMTGPSHDFQPSTALNGLCAYMVQALTQSGLGVTNRPKFVRSMWKMHHVL